MALLTVLAAVQAQRADETREAREGAAAAQAALAEAQADARRRESDLRCAEARLRDAKLVEAEAGTLRERLARLEGLTSAGKQVPELQAQLHSALEAADRQRVHPHTALMPCRKPLQLGTESSQKIVCGYRCAQKARRGSCRGRAARQRWPRPGSRRCRQQRARRRPARSRP